MRREAAILLVPADAGPVVEALQHQMKVVIGLQFENGETAVDGQAQHVEHGAIGSSKGGYLRVNVSRIQALVDRAHVARDKRLQPALGTKTVKRIAVGTGRMTAGCESFNESVE